MTPKTMTRLVALVGRPNVGKSTLFNRIVGRRKSLVDDRPGVTRDRLFAPVRYNDLKFFLCDTGGFEPVARHDSIKRQLVEQAELAIEEAAVVVFVADAKEGLHPVDQELVKRLRKAEKTFFVCVNKCDGPKDELVLHEFRRLGVETLFPVSAEHNRGVGDLLENILKALFPHAELDDPSYKNQELHFYRDAGVKPDRSLEDEDILGAGSEEKVSSFSAADLGTPTDPIRLAIVGRPNVGKSSLLNRLLGQERAVVDAVPGTTRDPIEAQITYHGRVLEVVDTAGIRRKSRMADYIEKYSVIRSLAAIEEAHVVVLVIDASEGVTEGDARVAGFAFDQRKPLLIVVNKWDLIHDKTSRTAADFTKTLQMDLKHAAYAPLVFTSCEENLRVSKIIPKCLELFDEAAVRHPTKQVNEALEVLQQRHTIPLGKNRHAITFSFATQVSILPPRFIIFCNHPEELHFSYKRFVENTFREIFGYKNVPIAVIFRAKN